MNLKIHNFTVSGAGRFPLDMLRHGQCWPLEATDVQNIDPKVIEMRHVHLGTVASPSLGRWESFGWTCEFFLSGQAKVIECGGSKKHANNETKRT